MDTPLNLGDDTADRPGFLIYTQMDAPDEARDAKIQATLAEAQVLVQNEQLTQALRVIVKAVDMCPCEPAGEGKQRHAKDKTCHIAQCMLAVNSGDPYALYEVANNLCTCGYRWPACTRQLHAAALDALADCLDKAVQYVAAFAVALSIIRLDPASAVGYCRGARIIRYLLKSASAHPKSAKGRAVTTILNRSDGAPSTILLRAVLGRFVQSGLRITDRHRRGPKDTYNVGGSIPIPLDTRDWSAYKFSQVVLRRMAYHLDCDEAHRDPVKEFPLEILGLVFSRLDTTDLAQCLRVNKQWNQLALQDDSWNTLALKRPSNPGNFFTSFLQQHELIRSLAISDATRVNLTNPKFFQMVFGLRQLDRLCLGFGKRRHTPLIVDLDATKATVRPKCRLTQLSLESFDLKKPVAQLLSLNADTLVTLNLANTSSGLSAVFGTVTLPNLKNLRMTAVVRPALRPGSIKINMKPVVVATPNLEQLHLDGFYATGLKPGFSADDWAGLWPSLRKIALGRGMQCHWNPRFLPPFPASLQSLEILGANRDVARNVLFMPPEPAAAADDTALLDGDLMDLDLPNLEVFRCLSSILKPRHLERILQPSAAAGKLQALELRAAFNHLTPPSEGDRLGDFVPARDLNFLNCSSLHTLGLHDFNFFEDPHSRWLATNEFYAEPFVEWLDCFPNLHTLGVYPGGWEAVGALIPRLIARPGIRAIHQQYLQGVSWDNAQKLARQHGVELCHTPAHMPAGWRVFEDFDDDTST